MLTHVQGNSRKHENSKDSEATLGLCDTLDKGERVGGGVSEVRMSDFQGIEEERNTRGALWATRKRRDAKRGASSCQVQSRPD